MRALILILVGLCSGCQVLVDYPSCAEPDVRCTAYAAALGRTEAEFFCDEQVGVCREWEREVCGRGDNDADGAVDEGLGLVEVGEVIRSSRPVLVQGPGKLEYLSGVDEEQWNWSAFSGSVRLTPPLVATALDNNSANVFVVPQPGVEEPVFHVLVGDGGIERRDFGGWPGSVGDLRPASVRIATGREGRFAIAYVTASGEARVIFGRLSLATNTIEWGSMPLMLASDSNGVAVARHGDRRGFVLASAGMGGGAVYRVAEFARPTDARVETVEELGMDAQAPASAVSSSDRVLVSFGTATGTRVRVYDWTGDRLAPGPTATLSGGPTSLFPGADMDSIVAVQPKLRTEDRARLIRFESSLLTLDDPRQVTDVTSELSADIAVHDGADGFEVLTANTRSLQRWRCDGLPN